MDRQRHAKDIAHPMYDTIDNALSAAVDVYYVIQCMKMMICIMFITHWSFTLSAHKNSKTCEMCSNTSY